MAQSEPSQTSKMEYFVKIKLFIFAKKLYLRSWLDSEYVSVFGQISDLHDISGNSGKLFHH